MRLGVTLNIGGVAQVQEHSPPQYQQQSYVPPPTGASAGWRSPVPYLFGGLAAMLGLIAFSLLILACSYWKLSGHLGAGDDSGELSGEGKSKDSETVAKYQDSIFVIMAGEEKPTFVATPATSRTTSLGASECDDKGSCSCTSSSSSSSSSSVDENRRENVVVTTMARTSDTNCDEEEKS